MLFLRLCIDKPDALELRNQHRDDHRAYLGSGVAKIVQAGPLLDESGDMAGSMIIVDAESLGDVQAFHDDDPFTKVGLFDKVLLYKWDRHIG
ncbi:MAG: YciI family protein [Sphingopyxis sp.]|nr:YciI family protein [Sphingopyxis sp.]